MSWRLNHPSTLVSRWPLQHAVGVITPDTQGRYPGTMVNAPTWGVGPKNSLQCVELDGDDAHVNVGDVTQLNAVSTFSICFWMNQDVIDQIDDIFRKIAIAASTEIRIATWNDGFIYLKVGNGADAYGRVDYSTVISAANWHHAVLVFDGSQTGNANRLIFYVDGNPVTLAFPAAPIPATTADLLGQDALIGHTATSFDGRLWDFRLYGVALSRDEINKIIHGPVPVV